LAIALIVFVIPFVTLRLCERKYEIAASRYALLAMTGAVREPPLRFKEGV